MDETSGERERSADAPVRIRIRTGRRGPAGDVVSQRAAGRAESQACAPAGVTAAGPFVIRTNHVIRNDTKRSPDRKIRPPSALPVQSLIAPMA